MGSRGHFEWRPWWFSPSLNESCHTNKGTPIRQHKYIGAYHMGFCQNQCVAVCCSVLQCVAVCCSVLQCVTVILSKGLSHGILYGVVAEAIRFSYEWVHALGPCHIWMSHVTYEWVMAHAYGQVMSHLWHITCDSIVSMQWFPRPFGFPNLHGWVNELEPCHIKMCIGSFVIFPNRWRKKDMPHYMCDITCPYVCATYKCALAHS